VLNGMDTECLSRSAEALRAKGHSVEEATFDVTDEAAVLAAFARLDAAGVEIDILVNNAGIQLGKPLVELTMAEWSPAMPLQKQGMRSDEWINMAVVTSVPDKPGLRPA
jgi:gluconate 5-dehydrogenase